MSQFECILVSSKDVRNATAKDTVLSRVYDAVMKGWTDVQDKEMTPFYNRRTQVSVHQGCLTWGIRVIIPQRLRAEILEELHEGHLGICKMKSLARSYVWWPGIDEELQTLTKRCAGCQQNIYMPPESTVYPWEWPQRAWQRVHADFAGPVEGSMFLVVVDAFSKWPDVIQMKSTTTERTTEVLLYIFARNGLSEHLVSDNGPQFVSEQFEQFMRYNDIRHTTSAPYHPRTNGLAERFVQTLKQALRASRSSDSSILTRLSNFLIAYRSTPQSTTNESPAKLFMGH